MRYRNRPPRSSIWTTTIPTEETRRVNRKTKKGGTLYPSFFVCPSCSPSWANNGVIYTVPAPLKSCPTRVLYDTREASGGYAPHAPPRGLYSFCIADTRKQDVQRESLLAGFPKHDVTIGVND